MPSEINAAERLRQELDRCPAGRPGWRRFEEVALEILQFLFVPPLVAPLIQPRTYSGIDRRDAVFPNRNHGVPNHWGHLLSELRARMILVEFKNYDREDVGKDEVNQTRNYLSDPMGDLALMVVNKLPNNSAHIKRNTIYSQDRKVILFLTKDHLKEMLYMKERDEDPADLVMDAVERFYLQHE
ncbi:hypothetical protein ABT297_11060 [Dactylosporangium sp. NPDC000555]|uniref:hypothetical protein n=1 Tax=Dactylosporangium sp. NPDC000555 TaxID=3154260 RepID=UPI00332E6803